LKLQIIALEFSNNCPVDGCSMLALEPAFEDLHFGLVWLFEQFEHFGVCELLVECSIVH
jgi:hypothetical protein